MPLIWRIPDDFPEEFIGEYDSSCSPDRFIFRSARVLDALPPATIRFGVPLSELSHFDCLPNSSSIPLVSQRLAALLLSFSPSDIQLFPATVHASDTSAAGFSLLNAISEVAAVDYARSAVVRIPGTDAIMKFNQLAHLPDALGRHHIARERDYRSHLLVSEHLAAAICSCGCTGIQFDPPESVHP